MEHGCLIKWSCKYLYGMQQSLHFSLHKPYCLHGEVGYRTSDDRCRFRNRYMQVCNQGPPLAEAACGGKI